MQVPLDEYLRTSYSPDMEYRDGVLVDRNIGDSTHSRMQAVLASYICEHARAWGVVGYIALTVKVREGWYAISDVCFCGKPGYEAGVMPLLWVEILSAEDRMMDVWRKANELVQNGVPNVWLIDPETLESELWTAHGVEKLADKTLRLPDSPVVIPLADVMKD
jgi:Uma2 family endonuclease